MAFTSYEAMPLDQMLNRVQKYHPGNGYQLVEKAWKFAEAAHAGQVRKSGEPYFIHPCLVASILTELMIDPPTISAGLLIVGCRFLAAGRKSKQHGQTQQNA